MTPGKVNLKIYQGATFRRTIQWKTGTPATPVNIAGWTGRMMIRKKVSDAAPIVSLTTANGGINITNGAQGTFEIYITATATAALTITTGVYDLELVSTTGDVTRLIEGTVTVSPEVTR